jgi:hypothetical protein
MACSLIAGAPRSSAQNPDVPERKVTTYSTFRIHMRAAPVYPSTCIYLCIAMIFLHVPIAMQAAQGHRGATVPLPSRSRSGQCVGDGESRSESRVRCLVSGAAGLKAAAYGGDMPCPLNQQRYQYVVSTFQAQTWRA